MVWQVQGDELRTTISVTNNTNRAVFSVLYPYFASKGPLDTDVNDDRILWPAQPAEGSIIKGPANFTVTQAASYPRDAFAQVTAYYGPTAGYVMYCRDTAGEFKNLWLKTSNVTGDRYVELTWNHIRPEAVGNDWTSYEISLVTFEGDWYDAADRYRNWAGAQFGVTKIANRTDIPDWLQSGNGGFIKTDPDATFLNSSLHTRFSNIKAASGAENLIFIPYGWENRGVWRGIFYLPAIPSDVAYRDAVAKLNLNGHHMALLMSGYHWVVKSDEINVNSPAFDDSTLYDRTDHPNKGDCVKDSSQVNWEGSNGIGTLNGLHTFLCRYDSDGNNYIRQRIKAIANNVGGELISYDQTIGGGMLLPCYATGHGHDSLPGYGSWMYTKLRENIEGVNIDKPGLNLMLEDTSELLITKLQTYWGRGFGIRDDWPNNQTWGVDLFGYLYHEYIPVFAGALKQHHYDLSYTHGIRYSAANACVRGLSILVNFDDYDLRTNIRSIINNAIRTRKNFKNWLVYGERNRPVEMTSVELFTSGTTTIPTVSHGTFKAQDGTWATFFGNASLSDQSITVKLGRTSSNYRLKGSNGVLVSGGNFGQKNAGDSLAFTVPMYDFVVLQE